MLNQIRSAQEKLNDPKRKERDAQKKLKEAAEDTAMWHEQT